jgi:DNA-binding response OmpR family regulator
MNSGKLRVLIVDDNSDFAAGIEHMIGQWGYGVERVSSAKAALRVAPEYRPRVVLLDLGLPDLHGYELAKRLREQARDRTLYFVVVTGWTQIADQLSSSAAGISHHLIKPVNFGTLKEILAAYQCAEEASLARIA